MIDIVIGTRPEAIKMAPVILECRRRGLKHSVISTGQHSKLLHGALRIFNIEPDVDMELMQPDQTPLDILSAALPKLSSVITRDDVVLAQGDTTTVLAAGMSAFHASAAFGHVEAGLRTGDLSQPFPEEYNRRVVAIGATWNFVPTAGAGANLIAEGTKPDRIFETGNTVVDALQYILHNHEDTSDMSRPYAMVTCHRRENHGENMLNVFRAVNAAASTHTDMDFIIPLHPSPAVQQAAAQALDANNIITTAGIPYTRCIHLMHGAKFILTDSGGIQEEATTLGVRTGVLRNKTERPEGVAAGVCELIGTDYDAVSRWIHAATTAPDVPNSNIYGDGYAAAKILDVVSNPRLIS